MTGDAFGRYLDARRREIDAALDETLPAPPACPPQMAEAMRYSVFAGGKRFRPILTLAAAEAAFPRRRGAAAPAEAARRLARDGASAIELVHTYSLVHDDLPAMDDDTLRRGRPTSHLVFGEGVAILAGDALLTHAFALLARSPPTAPPGFEARRLRAIACVAEAAGAAGMVGGQVLDLTAAGAERAGGAEGRRAAGLTGAGPARGAAFPAAGAEETLRDLHERKTGAVIGAAAVIGAVLAGGDETAVRGVGAYAAHLGLAFQIVDDILDVEGSTDRLGKTAGKDAAARKATYPSVHGLDRSRALAADAVAAARGALADAGLGGRLGDIAEWVLSRTS